MTKQTCQTCGATLPAPGAACRRCLLKLAANPEPEDGAEPVTTGAPRPGTPPPRPEELAPLFPELELGALLGAGGMGAVYRARQKRLGREVALKVLHAELARDPVFVQRFLREAQALARLAHPGIVAVHDFGEREGRCYLVMEHVDGTNLRALLKPGLLAPRQALDIVRQLCDALQFAHDEGIVHRDIKPENVLVDRAGKVKIADFGLAKLVGQPASLTLTDAGQVMGTPHYMAPEQLEHPRDVDHRADLFSLGVVFYEMLTGELPLGRFAPPSKRVEVDVRLDRIVLRTLERERELRYQSAVEVRSDVEAVQRGKAGAPGAVEREPDGLGVDDVTDELDQELEVIGLKLDLTTDRPTAWGWLVILFVCWVILGAAFNLGGLAFATMALVLLTSLFFALVRARSGVALSKQEPLPWHQRLRGGIAVALGAYALFLGEIAGFERWTLHYDARFQAPGEGLDLGWRSNDGLLERVGVARTGTSAVVAMDSAHTLDNAHLLYALHPLVQLCAAALLFALATFEIRGLRLEHLRSRLPEAARTLGLWFGALVLAHGLTFALHGMDRSLVAVSSERGCRGSADDLAQAVYRELIERGFTIHAEHHGRLVDVPSGSDLAELCVLKAAPASPFERWRMTWTGPRRLQPHLVVRVVSDLAGERAAITVEGGMVERSGPEEHEWRGWLEKLLAEAAAAGG